MSCDVDYYRGWVAHAQDGCEDCKSRLRAYYRQAKRDSRIRLRGARKQVASYDPEFRAEVVADAVANGARIAANAAGITPRLVYEWCKAAGVKAKPLRSGPRARPR